MTHTNQIRPSTRFIIFIFTALLAVRPLHGAGGAPSTVSAHTRDDQQDYKRNYARLREQVGRLRAALILAYGQDSQGADVMKIVAQIKARREPDLHDAWGTELLIELNPHYKTDEASGKSHILVVSAGPDRQFHTDDDLLIAFSLNTGRQYLRFLNQVGRLGAALSQAYDEGAEGGDLTKIFAKMMDCGAPDLRDEWGTELLITPRPFSSSERIITTYYVMRSAGPDRQFGTHDDLGIYIEARTGNLSEFAPLGNTIALKILSGPGPSNGLAEIVGTVDDVPDDVKSASVEAAEAHSSVSHHTQIDARGRFTLTSLPPGEYRVRVSSPGFWTLWQEVTLKPRDRAVIVIAMELCNGCAPEIQITGPVLDDDDLVVGSAVPIL